MRIAENFSMPTSLRPGFLRPAVSRISISRPLNLTDTRLISLVVPWREETRACCFFARLLNRDDLPTLGRPIRAILRGGSLVASPAAMLPLVPSLLKIADFNSLIPSPVVAEVRKMLFSSTPRARNSLISSASPLSDLFKTRKIGFLDLRARLAISLSRWSKNLVESRVSKMMSALSIASLI